MWFLKIKDRFQNAPALGFFTIFFIIGILTAGDISIPIFILIILCAFILFITFLLRKNTFWFVLGLSSLLLVAGIIHTKNYQKYGRDNIAGLDLRRADEVKLHGVIDSDPEYSKRITFTFRLKEIWTIDGWVPVKGLVLARVSSNDKFSFGDERIFAGRLYKPFDFGNQRFSYRGYLRQQDIFYIFSIRNNNKNLLIRRGGGNFLKAVSFKLKDRLKNIFRLYLKPINYRVLSALILGDRQDFPQNLRQAFVRTGTAHIIAISGFNVGIVVFMLLIFLKAIGIKRKARYAVIIPLLIIHCLAVGASPSVVRATIMAIILIGSYLINREINFFNSLALAALIILLFNPLQAFDAGFQLSFVSVLGIAVFCPRIIKAVKMEKKMPYFVRSTFYGFAVSLSAWLATLGFSVYYFGIISPITILANLIIVPLVSIVILLAFSLCLTGIFLPVLTYQIAATTNFVLFLLYKTTFFLSGLPFAYFTL